jgi:hypothetical protein
MFARTGSYAAAYTNKVASRDDDLKLLVQWIRTQPGSGLTLFGPQANSIENSAVGVALIKSGAASYSTWKGGLGWAERVIAMWRNEDALRKADDATGLRALGVLTWNIDETKVWAQAVGAIDLLTGEQPAAPTITDPVVLGALRSLTDSINMSSGLSHPSDFDHALSILKYFRSRGIAYDPALIEAWALANGWTYRHAAELRELAEEVRAGKRKRYKSTGRRDGAPPLQYWTEVAADEDWTPA